MEQPIAAVRDFLAQQPPRYALVQSFGCQLNQTDGEKLKGIAMRMGYQLTEDVAAADLILYNTCAIRAHAEERVFGRLGELKQYKLANPDLIIGLCGCMTAEDAVLARVRKSYPFVSLIVGTAAIDQLPQLLLPLLEGQRFSCNAAVQCDVAEGLPQVRSSTFQASVPIMFGCNNFCTYCIVPYVRGRERSRDVEAIVAEVRQLVTDGYREIYLLGQNVNSYGIDRPDGMRFPELLRTLDAIPGDYILRFMSSHPKDAGRDLIDAICACKHVAKQLHLPVQSGSDRILHAMNRRYTAAQYLEIVRYARERIPDFSMSTDIIVGFPNESDEEFAETLALLSAVQFDNVYSFIYSKRAGTKAAALEDATPDAVKTKRMRALLSLQREIATAHYQRFLGQTLQVLPEAVAKRGDGWLTGRSNEGIIVEFPGNPAQIGRFTAVRIDEIHNWAVAGKQLPTY